MKFFKHFTDAHTGRSMMSLFDEMGHAGPNCYWILVELCAGKLEKLADQEFTEADFKFNFHERLVRERFRLSSTKVQLWLDHASTLNLLSYEFVGSEIHIHMPKLLEILDRDTKRARKPRATTAQQPRLDKEEDKDKEQEEDKEYISAEASNLVPLKPANAVVTISSNKKVEIKTDLIKSWAETYPKEFLDMELKKARSWILANPQKSPKSGWGRFFNAWFDRGWEQYRKTLKSNPSAISVDDLNDLLGAS
ncbi:hypothetical protein [Bdellovibrio sp. HCB288]|uniref:hypothetical protein n=1 Tax=Bdellovibrio sp. HCB288 TaxID=3394355 RepID=UPI0039B4283F